MIERLKGAVLGLAAKALRAWAPDLAARLIAEIKPAHVADHVKPALRTVLAKLDPEWHPAFAKTLRLLAQVAAEVAAEAESYQGGKR